MANPWTRTRRGFTLTPGMDPIAFINQLPAANDDPNKIATIWPVADHVPTVKDAKFGLAMAMTVTIAGLTATSKYLRRDKLLWHVQNPGMRHYVNQFTTDANGKPCVLVVGDDDDLVIADGHHFLASGLILGFTTASAMCLPTITPTY